jgi:MraZ protein
MSRFFGNEICMLDAKGRITVPARMRRNLAPEANDTFVIVRSFDPCVNLYPADEWELFDAKLSALGDGDPDVREFIRGIYATAHEATLDGQGRLNIPDHLLEWAGVKKETILVGNKGRLELWHPATYEKRSASIDQGRMSDLAKRFLQ